MKAVLMSIKPKWCELVASGKKTVEVRKTKPKLEVPFKVYIYETKDKQYENIGVCGWKEDGTAYIFKNHCGKVIGEFVCDRITKGNFYLKDTCLTSEEYSAYCPYGAPYAWHITDLVIYDKPRELGEFFQVKAIRGYHKKDEPKTEGINVPKILQSSRVEVNFLTRPPQSWCYVEEVSNGSSK